MMGPTVGPAGMIEPTDVVRDRTWIMGDLGMSRMRQRPRASDTGSPSSN